MEIKYMKWAQTCTPDELIEDIIGMLNASTPSVQADLLRLLDERAKRDEGHFEKAFDTFMDCGAAIDGVGGSLKLQNKGLEILRKNWKEVNGGKHIEAKYQQWAETCAPDELIEGIIGMLGTISPGEGQAELLRMLAKRARRDEEHFGYALDAFLNCTKAVDAVAACQDGVQALRKAWKET